MKSTFSFALIGLAFIASLCLMSYNLERTKIEKTTATLIKKDSVLRHVVLFKFAAGTTDEKTTEIEEAFGELPSKISQITAYEWGLNNSPEGLDKGFTHCFFVSFKSEADRAIYLPHPDHQAFVEILKPHLEDVLVVDYWTK